MEKKDFRLSSMPSAMCHVTIKRFGETCEEQSISVELWSYYTHVLTIYYHADDQSLELHASGVYSRTTAKHINRFTTEFLGENLYHLVKSVCKTRKIIFLLFPCRLKRKKDQPQICICG